MPPLKALLFDLDGTLINSLADLAAAINRMLLSKGCPTRELELFPKLIGEGMRKLVERALPESARDPATVDECLREYMRQYDLCWHEQTTVYEGIHEVLVAAQAQGLRIGCISNKRHHFTQLCCAYFFPNVEWDVILGQREDVPAKPDPAGAHEAAALLGVTTAECAYIGDSGIDMEFATRAGMLAVGVLWGFRGEAELREKGAARLMSEPVQLLHLLSPA